MDQIHQGGSLGDLFVNLCRRFSSRQALVAGDMRLTYVELADRVGRMQSVLHRHGLLRGASAAILCPNRGDVMVATLACMVAGIRYTPISALSSLSDQIFILNDAEIDALIIDSVFERNVPAYREQVNRLSDVFGLGPSSQVPDLSAMTDEEPSRPPESFSRNGDISAIVYTGGTTGRPKGVVHTHNSSMAAMLLKAAEWEWPQEVRMLAATPVSHAGGALVFPSFMKGGSFHMIPTFTPALFCDYVAREKITMTFLVPVMIARLLDFPELEPQKLRSLETIIYGAAPIDISTLKRAIRRFGPALAQLYGQSEAPMCISYLGRTQHQLDDDSSLTSCGYPHAAIDVELLDDENRPVAAGEAGEICVRGALVMKEYWGRPDETAQAFAGGWLHTGDVGRFDSAGRLHIVDRKKDMIISGGFNVFPSEVEAMIMRHDSVATCAVVGVPDPNWGEAVTAVIVLKPGAALDRDTIIEMVRAEKGPVQAPKRVEILDTLPLTPIGKVDKKAIRSALTEPK